MIPSINDDVYVHKRRVSPVPTAPKPPSTAKASKIAGDKAKRVPVSSSAGPKTASTQPTSLRLRKQAQVPVSSATGTKATSRAPTSLRSKKEATSVPSVVASNPKLTRVSVRRDPLQESKTRIPKPEVTRLAQKSSAARLIKSPTARYSAQDSKTSKLPIAASYKQKENDKTVAVAVKKSLTRKDAVPITTKQSKTETSRRLSGAPGAPIRPSAPAGGMQNSPRLSRVPLYPLKTASNVRKPSVRALADVKARGEPKPQLATATKRSKVEIEEKSQASSSSCSEEETTPVGKGQENNYQFHQEKTKLNKKPSHQAVAKAKSSGLPRLSKGQPLAISTLKDPQSTKHSQWSSSTKIPTGANRQTYPRPTAILNRKSPPPETVEGKNSAGALPQSAVYRRRVDGVERTTPPKDKRRDMAARQDVQETAKETLKRLTTPLSPAKGSVAKQQKISTSPLPEPKPVNRRDFLRHPTSGGSNAIGSSASDRIVNPVRVSREISTRTPSRPDVSTKSVNMRDSCPRIVKPVARTQSQREVTAPPTRSRGPNAAAGKTSGPRIVKPVARSQTEKFRKPPSSEEVKVVRGGNRKSATNVKAKVVKPVSRDSIIPDRTVSSPGSLAVHKQGRPEAMDEKGIDLDPNDQLNTLANKSRGDDTKDCHSDVAVGHCDNFISMYQNEIDTIIALDPADLKAVDDVNSSSDKAIAKEDDMEVDEDGIVAEY